MANHRKIAQAILIFLLVFFLFGVKSLYATSVTVEGYTPLLSNWANLISYHSTIEIIPQNIIYGKKAKVIVTIYSYGKKNPLIDQRVVLSSPQESKKLKIFQPQKPTNKYGKTVGYIESDYNQSQVYTILALDTTYTEYPILIKENANLNYAPTSNYHSSNPLGFISNANSLIIFINIVIFLILLISINYLVFIKKIKDEGKFKNTIRFIRDYLILYIISILITVFDYNIFNLIIIILSVLILIEYFLYILL